MDCLYFEAFFFIYKKNTLILNIFIISKRKQIMGVCDLN